MSSKVVASLPKGLFKSSVLGALAALAAYVGLQALWALLIHRELVGMSSMYTLACVSAAVSAFLGCLVSLLRGREGAALSVSAVVLVFLTLTLAAALLTGQAVRLEGGLTGVGLSMAAGGLAAALVGAGLPRGGKRRKKRRKN
jgi:hypothetical protein